LAQCDGEWEHQYGVEINTLDNPGWRIRIDLAGTRLEEAGRHFQRSQVERSEDDWLHLWVEKDVFHAASGPLNLIELVKEFRAFAERGLLPGMSFDVRIRRLPASPVLRRRRYEVEVSRPGPAATSLRKITTSPVYTVEPYLGIGDAHALVDSADRHWSGHTGPWVTPFGIDPKG
jgi:hypothetical protein